VVTGKLVEVRVLLAAPTLSNANEWRKIWLSTSRTDIVAVGLAKAVVGS